MKLYTDCTARLVAFTGDDLSRVTRRTLTDFYAIRAETVAPATVSIDYRVDRVFLQSLVDEDELPSHPIATMKHPTSGGQGVGRG